MKTPSSHERLRLEHINKLMDELHDSSNEIYEGLIDRDFDSTTKRIDSNIQLLTELRNSISNELWLQAKA